MEAVSLGDETSSWRGKLEGPEESVDFLEVWTNGEDLVDDIFGTMDTEVSKVLRDERVVSQRDSRSVDLQVTSLVNQLSDSGKGRMTESNIGSNSSKHLHDRTIDLQEDTVVKLLQSEKLQDLSGFGSHLVDTDESCCEQELGLRLNEEVAVFSCLASKSNKIKLTSSVLLVVLDRSLLEFLSSLSGSLKVIHNNAYY